MTTAADTYRQFAEECLLWAEETDNEEHRQAFLDMAVAWIKLAAHGPNGELKATRAIPNTPYQQSDSPDPG
jgi:hypothetical protein